MNASGYPVNCWYVAAVPQEVGNAPLARTILGQSLVIYRTEAGRFASLEDRCVHRMAPLSKGCVVGEHLRCGYHGAEFAADGRCVVVPGQDRIPPEARVRSFPVQERYGFIWVWPGNPALAPLTQPCPIYGYLEEDSWDTRDGYMRIACSYLLVNDNLADVSHTEFVHASTLGSPYARTSRLAELPVDQQGQHTFESELVDGGINFRVRVNHTRLAPTFENAFLRVNATENLTALDFQLDFVFRPPGFWIFRPTTLASGAPLDQGLRFDAFIVVTPETATSCHYFHKSCQRYAPGNPAETAYWHEQTTIAFQEDKAILEAQQQSLGTRDIRDFPHVSFQGDRLSYLARQLVRTQVTAETGGAAS